MLIDILSPKNSSSNTNTKNIITAISSARGKKKNKAKLPKNGFRSYSGLASLSSHNGRAYYRIFHRLKNFKSVEIESAFCLY